MSGCRSCVLTVCQMRRCVLTACSWTVNRSKWTFFLCCRPCTAALSQDIADQTNSNACPCLFLRMSLVHVVCSWTSHSGWNSAVCSALLCSAFKPLFTWFGFLPSRYTMYVKAYFPVYQRPLWSAFNCHRQGNVRGPQNGIATDRHVIAGKQTDETGGELLT